MNQRTFLVSVCLLFFAHEAYSQSMAPEGISFQLNLTDSLDVPITGAKPVIVTLEDAKTGGNVIWTRNYGSVGFSNGLANIVLENGTPDMSEMVFEQTLWLMVDVDGEALGGSRLEAVPYAHSLRSVRVYPSGNATDGPNIVGGHPDNSIDPSSKGSTIAGGGRQSNPNTITGNASTIGGGLGNTVTADSATIAGGAGNDNSGDFATIGGGWTHVATGDKSTISGGQNHDATAEYATVSGGRFNRSTARGATVGGGGDNAADEYRAVVAGGSSNLASDQFSSVGGGRSNVASGIAATVPGGSANLASGTESFAAGKVAEALHDWSFVWNGHINDTLRTTGPGQFVARATGGFTFLTAVGAATGAELPAGTGAWASLSSVDAKTDFEQLDGTDVLDRLDDIDILQWRYKGEASSIRHVGPMAQDFYAAFGLGKDDRHIMTIDADGIALAAIKALRQRTLN